MKKDEDVLFSPPPRLLLGAGLIFWGSMVENPVAGLIAAILLEARHWMSLRWKFGETGFARAWQLSVLILLVTAVVRMSSDDDRVENAMAVLSSLPLIFLPLMLAQQYASDRGVPVTTFSFVARRKLAQDRKEGRAISVRPMQLGFPYMGLVLASSGLGREDQLWYGIGVTILLGLTLGGMKRGKLRPFAWSAAFVVANVLGAGMVAGTYWAYGKYTKMLDDFEPDNSREVRTSLGEVRDLKLESKIHWRYQHLTGERPSRLRLSTYNIFGGGKWQGGIQANAREVIPEERSAGAGIAVLFSDGDGLRKDHAFQSEDFGGDFISSGIVRGRVNDESLLPLPETSRLFPTLAADALNVNALGTTKVSEPEQSAIAVEVRSDFTRVMEEDPAQRDLEIPSDELKGVSEFLEKQGFDLKPWSWSDELPVVAMEQGMNQEEALRFRGKLGGIFQKDFRYTLQLRPLKGKPHVSQFLNDNPSGHCEYFASSTTLLLRRLGIPARYVVGYAMDEYSSEDGEWLMRGKHAHAWAQAYVGGTWRLEQSPIAKKKLVWRCRGGEWVTFDLTPPDWLKKDRPNTSAFQQFKDWWQLFAEDTVLWFGRPLVALITKVVMALLVLGLVAWIIYRLWTTRSTHRDVSDKGWAERCQKNQTIRDFEQWLRKRIGPRPTGTPFAEWVTQAYPGKVHSFMQQYQAIRFDPASNGADLETAVRSFKKEISSE